MQKNSLIFAALMSVVGFAACDEGDIHEQVDEVQTSGKTAKLVAHVAGTETWGTQYNVVLAGFAGSSNSAVVQKRLPEGATGDVVMTLDLTDDGIETIELCITNRLRERIVSFAQVPVQLSEGDTLLLDAGNVDMSMFQSIQDLVFSGTCARCHGLGNTPAGSLTLTEGQSYGQLVNHAARVADNGTRVVPGDAAASLLHKVIHGDPDAGISFDHSNMIKEATTIALIDNWITGGAKP